MAMELPFLGILPKGKASFPRLGAWGEGCARRSWQQTRKDRSRRRTDGQGLGLSFLRKVMQHGDICLAKSRAGKLEGKA